MLLFSKMREIIVSCTIVKWASKEEKLDEVTEQHSLTEICVFQRELVNKPPGWLQGAARLFPFWQRLSTGDKCAAQWGIWQCLEIVLVVTAGEGMWYWFPRREARECCYKPCSAQDSSHQLPPSTKHCLAQHVNRNKLEKYFSMVIWTVSSKLRHFSDVYVAVEAAQFSSWLL